MSRRRRFNRSERRVLEYIAEGLCEWCGDPLPESWHADHIYPYSAGGPTTLGNGQALCPRCNLEKGSNVVTNTTPQRRWQSGCFSHHLGWWGDGDYSHGYAIEATCGAGKTRMAVDLLVWHLSEGNVHQCVWVVPHSYDLVQAERVLNDAGITTVQVQAGRAEAWKASNAQVVLMTYAYLSQPMVSPLLAQKAARQSMGVVFDEIHHAAQTRAYGDAVAGLSAFTVKILLSGTPYRADGLRIPFLRYTNGQGDPNYVYGYSQALADDPPSNRPLFFQYWDTPANHPITYRYNGAQRSCTFADDLPDDEAALRLRMALDLSSPDSYFLPRMLDAAVAETKNLRLTDAEAALLITCMHIAHAREVVRYLRAKGETPVLVVSLGDGGESLSKQAQEALDSFRDAGSDPKQFILVTVKMVTEGVDIPRLRVLAWATNVTEGWAFVQYTGRIIRCRPGEAVPCPAIVYLPADPRLIAQAETFKDRVRAHLGTDDRADLVEATAERPDRDRPILTPISSAGEAGAVLTHDGDLFQRLHIEKAEHALSMHPLDGVDKFMVAKLLSAAESYQPVLRPVPSPATMSQRAASERKSQHAYVATIAERLKKINPAAAIRAYALINGEANKRMGVADIDDLGDDPEKLAERREHLEDIESEIRRRDYRWRASVSGY